MGLDLVFPDRVYAARTVEINHVILSQHRLNVIVA